MHASFLLVVLGVYCFGPMYFTNLMYITKRFSLLLYFLSVVAGLDRHRTGSPGIII